MRKILLPLLLLAGMTLVGCGGGNNTPKPEEGYGVEIANKAELQEDWYAGTSRDLNITLTPEGNPALELANETLKVKSSNESVIKVTGLGLNALAEGSAKITVTYHGWKDTLDLTILHTLTVQEKYGVTHSGTAEDPLTNEEALTVAKHEKYAEYQDDLHVGGTIASFYHAPGSRTDGAVSWFLKPAEGQTEKFEVYKCYKAGTGAASYLTDDDVWVNGYAIAHGKFTSYNGQYETSSALFVSCEGNKPAPRQTIQATLAEVLEKNATLADGADSYDYYQFDAYVTVKDGNNYFLTATKGEALVTATSDEAHGSKSYFSNAFEIYGGQAVADKLLKNAKVTVKSIIKNYHGQAENLLSLTADDVTVVNAGEPWVITYQEVTFAEALTAVKALADGATSETYYKFQGEVTEINYTWSATNKNMTFTMKGVGDNAVTPETFKCFKISTEDETLVEKVVVGATVTVGGKLQNYVQNETHTYEVVNGLILAVEEQGGGGGGEETRVTFDAKVWAEANSAVSGTTKVNSYDFDSVAKFTLTGTDANTGKIYGPGNTTGLWEVRAYKSGSATLAITVAEGYEIVSATGVIGSANWDTGAATTFTVSNNAVSFNNNNANFNIKSITVAYRASGETPVEIPQPQGTFFGSVELSDAGKTALQTSSNIVPLFIVLGENNAVSMSINGVAHPVTFKSYDKTTGDLVITHTGFNADITMTYDPETTNLTKLATPGSLLKYDGGQSLRGNDKLKYWNCDGTTEQLQAQFNRRYGDPWTIDTVNADKITQNTEHFISGSALRLRPYADNRFSLATKDFAEPFNCRNISFWVYVDGETNMKIQCFGYTQTGYSTSGMINPFGLKEIEAGKWTYISVGFTASNLYGFQIFVQKGSSPLIFDDICLF